MLAMVCLRIKGGWVLGRGSRVHLRRLGNAGPRRRGWDVGWGVSIGGVRHLGVVRESGVWFRSLEMLADMEAIAEDMSAIAASRRSAAWKTKEKESRSQGVRIVARGIVSSLVDVVAVVASSSV